MSADEIEHGSVGRESQLDAGDALDDRIDETESEVEGGSVVEGWKARRKETSDAVDPSDGSDLVALVLPEEEHRGQTSAFG